MYLLAAADGIGVGDVIVQLVFLLVLIAVVVGIVFLVGMFSKRNKRLDKIEEKLDRLLSDKDK